MTSEDSIRVNFGRPIPIFPLAGVTLLPQQVLPLHIFEPRYRQMVSRALDSSGQIAMASFRTEGIEGSDPKNPPIRSAVCVGQIVQHEQLADGRYNLLLQGVCRARIVTESPSDSDRLYREAVLDPIGTQESEHPALEDTRTRISEQLTTGSLAQLETADQVLEFVENDDVPTGALLELIAFTLVDDDETRYKLLEEGDPLARAQMLQARLDQLDRLLRAADRQRAVDWPKGCSWN